MTEKTQYTKFQIGDTVRYVGWSVSTERERERYMQGKVVPENEERHLKIGGDYKVVVVKDTHYGFWIDIQGEGVRGDMVCVHGCSSSNFIKVNSTGMKITTLVKKLLDKDTRTLVSAGFINGDLALTDEGVAELLGVLFLANKEEMVKIAEEKLKEISAKQ